MRIRNNTGFSLGELITVMGILTVLAAIALPNLIGWRDNAQLGRAAQDVYSNLQKAKVEAARRNTAITITFSANDYVVYVDADSDWAYDVGEEIKGPIPWSEYPGVLIDTAQGGGDGLSFANPDNGVTFAPNGFPNDNTGALAGGTIFLLGNNGETSSITISPAGNVRIN